VPILAVDLSFATANLTKLLHGGWFPLAVAGSVFAMMSTWKRGRQIVSTALRAGSLPLDLFTADLAAQAAGAGAGNERVHDVGRLGGAPPVLLHHLKHNKVLHERALIMSVMTERVPTVPRQERLDLRELGEGIWVAIARYGFMESPRHGRAARGVGGGGHADPPHRDLVLPGPGNAVPDGKSRLARWRKKLFIVMARNARGATAYFGLPQPGGGARGADPAVKVEGRRLKDEG
jgi:KUP system potassium uptake protein